MRSIRFNAAAAFVLCIAVQASAQENSAELETAKAAATEWIALVDGAAYAESWETAAPVFQTGISQEQWAQRLEQVRGQVGGVATRTLADSQYRTSLPNAPDGEYVVLQYISAFERLPQAMEMVVMTKTDAGSWQAAGYQVVPAQQPGQQGQHPQQGQNPQQGEQENQ